uniref:Death domain-containing protein n=1 Tax=Amphimedon queenslandica TaxID=400682 RepID=A0A1X7SME4_AMPQE
LFSGVCLFSLVISLILIEFLFTGLVNINSTTADKANILTISDLQKVLDVLDDGYFPSNKWLNLGLSLGLLNPKLDTIEHNYPKDSERCLQKCLTLWLTEDIEATWSKLADAVDNTGEKAVAAYIIVASWITMIPLHALVVGTVTSLVLVYPSSQSPYSSGAVLCRLVDPANSLVM